MAGVIQIEKEKVKEKIKEEIDSFFKTAKRKKIVELIYVISKSSVKECRKYTIIYRNYRNNIYYGKSLSIYFYYYRTKHIGRLRIEYDYSEVVLEHELDIDLLRELEKFTYSYFKDLENKLANKEKATKVKEYKKEYKDIFKAVEVIYYLN